MNALIKRQRCSKTAAVSAALSAALSFSLSLPRASAAEALRAAETRSGAVAPPAAIGQDSQPKTHYEQIFIEDIQNSKDYRYEISAAAGRDLLHPSTRSFFASAEIKYKLSPLAAVGLEGMAFQSKPSAAAQAMEDSLKNYGLRLGHSLPKNAGYINGHYGLFKSHLNFAGLFKARADFPAHLGIGFMSMAQKNILFRKNRHCSAHSSRLMAEP